MKKKTGSSFWLTNKVFEKRKGKRKKKTNLYKDYILFQLVNLEVFTIGNFVTIQFLMLLQPKKKTRL